MMEELVSLSSEAPHTAVVHLVVFDGCARPNYYVNTAQLVPSRTSLFQLILDWMNLLQTCKVSVSLPPPVLCLK